MTGFGSAKSKHPHQIQISVKSVNGRYLETRLHMGREFIDLEGELKRRLALKVRRGSVDIFVSYPRQDFTKKKLKVDKSLLKSLIQEARSASKSLGLDAKNLVLKDFLSLPGVLNIEESVETSKRARTELLKVFDAALAQLIRERKREGQSLIRSLNLQLKKLKVLATEIRRLSRKYAGNLESKLHDRFQKKAGENMDANRLGQELIFYLDRADINEELTRLEEHIRACQNLLSKGKEVGKRMDFYCQELLREVNTMGSKSASAEMTRKVVDAKTLVESVREQVQNLE